MSDSFRLRSPAGDTPLRPATLDGAALRSEFVTLREEYGLDPEAILAVRDTSPHSVRVFYNLVNVPAHPVIGDLVEAMVVRSTAGFPQTNLDGSAIMWHLANAPSLNNGWASVVDSELLGAKWYYYAVFARYDDTSGWFKVAEQSWLNPQDHGYPERIWQAMPEYYRRIDASGWVRPGVLQRLCNVLGYETNTHRTWASTLGDVWDFEKLSAKLIPEAGAALGLEQNTANGDKRLRNLVNNLMFLRKIKGTKDGIEGYVSTMSGYPSRTYEGLNLMHRIQHTEFLNPFANGAWSNDPLTDNHPGWTNAVDVPTVRNSGQLSRQVSIGGGTFGPPIDVPYLRATNNTGVSGDLRTEYGCHLFGNEVLIPVTAGRTYRFSTALSASVAGTTVEVQANWGASTTTHALVTVGTTWVRARTAGDMVAPAGATYVRLALRCNPDIASNGHINIWKPIFIDTDWRPEGIPSLQSLVPLSSALAGDLGTYVHEDYYEPPREVKVNAYPQRSNFALNSNFKLDNQPPGAWGTGELPTYGQIPLAYSDYADIIDAEPGDSEVDYADLAAGLAPLTGLVEPVFETTGEGGYVWVPGSIDNGLLVPHGEDIGFSGPFTLVAKLTPDIWPLPSTQWFAGKWNPVGANHAWALRIETDGQLGLLYSTNGSDFSTIITSGGPGVVQNPDGSVWAAWVFRPDDAAGNRTLHAWTSVDGSTWTAAGSTSAVGVVTLFNAAVDLLIGNQTLSTVDGLNAKIQHVSLRNGAGPNGEVGGTEVFRFDAELDVRDADARPFKASTGQWVTPVRSAAAPRLMLVPKFPVGFGRMYFPAYASPHAVTARSGYFPVTRLGGMSAAVSAWTDVSPPDEPTKLALRMAWYTDNDFGAQILGADGSPIVASSPDYVLGTTEGRYELTKAEPPDNAAFGRLELTITNSIPHVTSFRWALIEDAPYPGQYFNGDDNNGDDGDFFFALGKGYTGVAHHSPSVYYQSFRQFALGSNETDTISVRLRDLVPYGRTSKLITAANGLFNAIS